MEVDRNSANGASSSPYGADQLIYLARLLYLEKLKANLPLRDMSLSPDSSCFVWFYFCSSVFDDFYISKQLSVVVGNTDISSKEDVEPVFKIVPHPDYR